MNYKLFLLSLCLVALSGITLADSTIPKSTYDWTGVYVGGFVGGATGANVTNKATNSPKLLGVKVTHSKLSYQSPIQYQLFIL